MSGTTGTILVVLAIFALAYAVYYIARHGVKTNVNVKYNAIENIKASFNSALQWLNIKKKQD